MKRWMISVFLLIPTWVFSQFYFYDEKYLDPSFLVEAGFGLGLMSCKTDLGKKGLAPSIQELNSSVSMMARVQWHKGLAIKTSYTSGRISAADSLISSDRPGDIERKKRNLHFFSTIRELTCTLEWFPRLSWSQYEGLQPFILAGAGYFKFRPQGEIKGQRIDLAGLRTEGLETGIYRLQQTNILCGFGLRYEWNARISTTIVFEQRILFTDHLDDVSGRFIDPGLQEAQMPVNGERWLRAWYDLSDPVISKPGAIRGNPGKNDSYSTLSLCVGIELNRKRIGN